MASSTHYHLSFHPSKFPRISLPALLDHPSVLASVLAHLEWDHAIALLNTSRETRHFFRSQPLRHAFLSRFVPGYATALRHSTIPSAIPIHVSIHDLDLFMISQKVPLHKYPRDALTMMTSFLPSLEDDAVKEKYIALTQAHSRIVLLLQSLVHSSDAPIPPEHEEVRLPLPPLRKWNPRELTFPAPLSYSRPLRDEKNERVAEIPSQKRRSKQRSFIPSSKESSAADEDVDTALFPLKTHAPRPSADSASSMIFSKNGQDMPKIGRKLSILRRKSSSVKAPPPLPQPRALQIYAHTWRRSAHTRSESARPGSVHSLKRPHMRFASLNISSESSISGVDSPAPASSSSSSSPSESGESPIPLSLPPVTFPHGLSLATSRTRAPILRVFHPCISLESDSIMKCEQQLTDSGLWEHLSKGDVVCNLGFVPSADNGSETSSTGNDQKWLLFNGEYLVPYVPTDILPIDDPLSLPSPFYYSHIMPPTVNPVFIIPRFPVCDDIPQLNLMQVTDKVRSPHSQNGVATVKKYAWTARLVYSPITDEEQVGLGWLGEWVLQGDGTPEGRQELLYALDGKPLERQHWQLVRDRCGGGRIWLKCLPPVE